MAANIQIKIANFANESDLSLLMYSKISNPF
jgi:hypothetical protein